jgi:hypothetical protein
MKLINEYKNVDREEFKAFLQEVEKLITDYCPEWKVFSHNTGLGIIYHVARHDFSACNKTKGTDKEWVVDISQVPFAIERPDGNIQIADVLPIQLKYEVNVDNP